MPTHPNPSPQTGYLEPQTILTIGQHSGAFLSWSRKLCSGFPPKKRQEVKPNKGPCTLHLTYNVGHTSSRHLAIGQNPNRTPSEHPNPTAKIGSKMGGEFTYPKLGSPLVLTHSHLVLTPEKRKKGNTLHQLGLMDSPRGLHQSQLVQHVHLAAAPACGASCARRCRRPAPPPPPAPPRRAACGCPAGPR